MSLKKLVCAGLLLASFWINPVNAASVSPTGSATYLYVSPTGSDTNAGTISTPLRTLAAASAAVRTRVSVGMNGDIVVYLRGGLYPMSSTLNLGASDSGQNGYSVIYASYTGESAVLSGGKAVTGWSLYDSAKNIYRASVGVSWNFRQLYVNGHHAQRARGPVNPSGFTRTSTGFSTNDNALLTAANPTQIEVVFLGDWMTNRCKVASVSGSTLNLVNPCWSNAQWATSWGASLPSWIENSYTLLDQPGEFYLNRTDGYVYYIPRSGEVMSTAQVIAPALSDMIVGSGVHHVQFVNLAFEHSNWTDVDSPDGYVGLQQGYHKVGSGAVVRMHAPIAFTASKNIVFDGDVFTLLGSRALNFDGGSQNIQVRGSTFVENAGGAVQFGQISDAGNTNTGTQNRGMVVQGNSISATSFDYRDDAAVNGLYVAEMKVIHNDIFNVPGFAVSIGWGWGANSYAQNSEVGYNRIDNFSQDFRDNAAIYTLSAQPGMRIHDNYIRNGNKGYGCLYPDEGSAYMTWSANVCSQVNQWLHLWTGSIHDNSITGNFSDTTNAVNNGTNNNVSGNTFVSNGSWPAAAAQIMSAAGVTSSPPPVPGPDPTPTPAPPPPPPPPAPSALGFGGMYSSGANNPITGRKSCASGYSATQLLGASNDNPLYYCSRKLSSGQVPEYDFGGVFGYGQNSSGVTFRYNNPVTGSACPSGYTQSKVYGTSGKDNDLYACYRRGWAGGTSFYGMYSIRYVNAATGAVSCPVGSGPAQIFGSLPLDAAVYLCK